MTESTLSPNRRHPTGPSANLARPQSETTPDTITAAPLRALSATLDRDDAPVAAGSTVPPLWHWLYFLPHARQSELGPDGHPAARRFSAARAPAAPHVGRGPPALGTDQPAASRARRWSASPPSSSVTHKAGRSGELLFVQVEHRFRNAQGLSLTEEHDIVYRAAAQPGDAAPRPQTPPLAGQQQLVARDHAGRRAAVPLLGAHLQRPPHPLRPQVRRPRWKATRA